jgi:hypothetical protein
VDHPEETHGVAALHEVPRVGEHEFAGQAGPSRLDRRGGEGLRGIQGAGRSVQSPDGGSAILSRWPPRRRNTRLTGAGARAIVGALRSPSPTHRAP